MYIHQLKNALAVLVITLVALPVTADDWPQWRGPNRDAKSKETGLLQIWPTGGPPLKWQTDSLGEGYASVVVANSRLHTIGNEAGTIFAYGLSEETGEILWKTKIGESSRHAMSTPTIDGDYLYALDPDGELACLHVVTTDSMAGGFHCGLWWEAPVWTRVWRIATDRREVSDLYARR